jgi:putative MATE family efflux protein
MMGSRGVDATKGNVFGKLFVIALPIVFTMILQNFFELTDNFWLGRYSQAAIAATQVSRTIIWCFMALAMGIGVGGSTLISQAKGAKSQRDIERYAGQTLFVMMIISLLVTIALTFFTREILVIMNTPASVIDYSETYVKILMIPAPIVFWSIGLVVVLNGLGNTVIPFLLTLITVLLNVILDPIMIFGFSFIPEMGIKGAAIATMLSRATGAVFITLYVLSGKAGISLKFENFKPCWSRIKKILSIGIPGSIGSWGTSLGFLILMSMVSKVANIYHDGDPTLLNAYGISGAVIGVYFFITIGLGDAVGIIVGQNIGARQTERAEKTVWQAFAISLVILTLGFIVMYFFGGIFSRIFVPASVAYSQATEEIVSHILKIISHGVISFGLLCIILGAFRGAGYAIPVMIINLVRMLVIRIPLAYVLAFNFMMGADGIWWSMSISNHVVGLCGFYLFVQGRWKRKPLVAVRAM